MISKTECFNHKIDTSKNGWHFKLNAQMLYELYELCKLIMLVQYNYVPLEACVINFVDLTIFDV